MSLSFKNGALHKSERSSQGTSEAPQTNRARDRRGWSSGASSSVAHIAQNASLAARAGAQGFYTVLSDQQDWERNESAVRTTHAVIAASVLQNLESRPNAAPSLKKVHQSQLAKVPKHWKDLHTHPLGAHFKRDCERELKNLESRECWRVIARSEATTEPIPLQWVFTYKVDSQGFIEKCKSRIVVRGDLQDSNSIESTYAATLAARSFRVAAALVARFDLESKQFDVVNAFINAPRGAEREPVVCLLPDGFKIPGKCALIDQALYGLKDSPALWYKNWTDSLKRIGLRPCREEPCLYQDEAHQVFVLFFVDDFLVLYYKEHEASAQRVMSSIGAIYELRELGDVEWFLGIRIIRNRGGRKLWLLHDTYIEKIARKFDKATGKCASTPLPIQEFHKHEGTASRAQIKEYQEKVGSILYTAIMIRADVAFAASLLSRYLTNPSSEHLAAADHCIQYLWGTRFLAIQYGGHVEAQLVIASDASFADDLDTRRSSQGYVMSLFGGIVVWKATRQDTVTTSTTEAELLSVGRTAQEAMALSRLFQDINLELGEMTRIFCDNQQTIRLIVGENERITTKLRHVDIQNMWIRQEHAKGVFQVTYLPTNDMPADGLTKNLSRQKFEHFRALLNLIDVRGMLESIS